MIDWQRRCELLEAEVAHLLEALCHDLRAPVRAADGFSRALLRDAPPGLDDETRDYLERIRGATAQMGGYLDALARLSRVARAQLRPAAVDLSMLAEAVLDDLRSAHPERQVQARVAAGLTAVGDPQLLSTLLRELLDNAWRHGGGRIEVRGDGERIWVSDEGEGFDLARAPHLFEPFGRVHPPEGAEPRPAMGLAVAQRIVHRHGGRIWAESAPGKGATFSFTLP
jgi:signal transduction histidine kinase